MTRLSEPSRSRLTPLHTIAAGHSVAGNGSLDHSPRGPLVPSVSPAIPAAAPPPPTLPQVPGSVIAARLRWFRTERGLRLEDVAKRAGYTKGFLSKIEHGKALPPVATLLRVAAALGVEADVLFAPDAGVAPDASVHTPAGGGVPVRDDTAGPGRSLLAVAAIRHHKLMEPFVVTVEPGQPSAGGRHTCPGEEFVYVLDGELDYAIGDETFHLRTGDGLYFNATKPHVASARGESARFVRVFCASPARRQRTGEVE
jgi:quercetin dioxygenase-like cupin family protein/DNA-binding XRE family transcriptional regulator